LSFFVPLIQWAQEDTSFSNVNIDSIVNVIHLEYQEDSVQQKDTVPDTLVAEKFIGYDRQIYRNSKDNLRKTLSASSNPPIRKNLNNFVVFVWGLFILLLIIFFKYNFALQYRLLNKSWISSISFNEFFSTQTSVFKNSKLLTWLIVSQCISLGVYIILENEPVVKNITTPLLILIISVIVMLIFTANQFLKNVFAYSFYQPSLSLDYAIIFRIHAYISSLVLLPIVVLTYYNGTSMMKLYVTSIMITYIIIVYIISLVKFFVSGRFLQNQSNFILILYLCAFEILPLFVLVKSITNLLEYD
jgi:hypothetical protein